MGAALLCSHQLLQKYLYEVLLRFHQALAVLCIYAIWRHLEHTASFSLIYIYISAGFSLSIFTIRLLVTLYRNASLDSGMCRAEISHINDIVQVRLTLPRHLKVSAGQYIGLWIPRVSFWSCLQIHPFTVVSWTEEKTNSLDLLVESRGGFTRRLHQHSKRHGRSSQSCVAVYTGPHGISVPVEDYETVLVVASDFGVFAPLPYLKQLMYGYKTCKSRTRRIHLVWQTETFDSSFAAVHPFLNSFLDEDTEDNGYILTISIYVYSKHVQRKTFGRRAKLFNGYPNLERILEEEREGKYIKKRKNEIYRRGKILVLISGTGELRDNVKALVRPYVTEGVRYIELEYQPHEHEK